MMQPVLIFGATVLSVLVAWYIWTRAQRRLNYDLKDIPGPKQHALFGNLGSIFGSSYFHKVSLLPRSCVRTMACLRGNLETCIKLCSSDGFLQSKLGSKSGSYTLVSRTSDADGQTCSFFAKLLNKADCAGFSRLDRPIWSDL